MLPQTQFGAHGQYLDARYDDFAYLRPSSAGPPITGCAVSPATGGVDVDCSGERAPNAPEWTLNLSAEHGILFDDGARLLATAHAHYQSTTLTGLDFTPLEYQDAYWSLDMALSLTTGDGKYRLGVFGTNLTDETVVANTFQPPLGSFVIGTLRPPRLYGLRFGVRF